MFIRGCVRANGLFSCERCRKRHIRCDGGEKCSNCERSNASCVYVEGEKKIMVSLKYLQKLQDELTELRSANEGAKTGNGEPSHKRLRLSAEDDNNSNDPQHLDISSLHNPPMVSSAEGSGSQIFQGSSSLSLFGLEIKYALPCGADNKVDFNEHLASAIKNCCDNCTVIREGLNFTCIFELEMDNKVAVVVNLPQYSHVLKCLDMYILYLSGCFYYLNLGQFRKRLYELYYKPTNLPSNMYTRSDIFFLCQVLLICALGEMYHRETSPNARTRFKGLEQFPGIGHFDKAYTLINMLFDGMLSDHSDTALVEVIMLFSFYHQVLNASSGYYIFSGVCLRAATTMGMHVNSPANDAHLTKHEIEHRRRLWWSIYIVDRYMSAKLGFPISIPEESIITDLPQDIANDPESDLSDFPPANYINAFIRVMQISSWMLLHLYQPSIYDKKLLPTISSVLSKLYEWRRTVPPALDIDFTLDDSAFQISRTVANVYSEYYQCINLTVRPLLLHFMRQRILDKVSNHAPIDISSYSEHITGLLNASLDASIQMIKIHTHLHKNGSFSVYGYLDREYTFSAASTLVMFNVAFGTNRTTQRYIQDAIQLLSISDGNIGPFAPARKRQLLNFISAFDYLGNTHTPVKAEPTTIPSNFQGAPATSTTTAAAPAITTATYDNNFEDLFRYDKLHAVPSNLPVIEDVLDSGERAMWDEISTQAFWLGNVSDDFKNLIDENL